MFGFGKRKEVVGLDIGASCVKAMQLRKGRRGYALQNLGIAPLHPETIVDGVIMDADTVSSTVRQLFLEHTIKTKDVVIAVSGHSVIVKKIQMQRMTEWELEESIQWEAEQHIPFSIEDVNLDYQILDTLPADSAEMEVLLVAVKKDVIHEYLNVIYSVGLNAVVVDVDAFALENAFSLSGDARPDEVIALINLGAAITTINILKGASSLFTRDSVIGGNHFTEAIQKALGLSFTQAESLKLGTEVEGRAFADAQLAIDAVNAELLAEIRRSFDFFSAGGASNVIHRVVLSGGTARLRGLDTFLAESLGLPVQIANPLRGIQADARRFDQEYLDYVAPQLAVCVGLAIREGGDK
jgi:type IV pilus assembly protein PilM